MNAIWRVDDNEPGVETPVGPDLVGAQLLVGALRRLWFIWVGSALAGLVLGVAWVVYMPVASVGTTTLLLGHPTATDPGLAMSTDVALARTRTVAERVVGELDLGMTPEDFQDTVTSTAATPDVLTLEVAGPHDRAARDRARALAEVFLDFRSDQMSKRARAAVQEYEARIATLQEQSHALTEQYEKLSAGDAAQQDRAPAILAERASLNSEITRLREAMEETSMGTEVIILSSGVLDPASVRPFSPVRRAVLVTASGLAAGLVAGVGLVVFMAITSSRLRRRDEVAAALDVPVKASVGRLRSRPWTRLGRSGPPDVAVVIDDLVTRALPQDEHPARLVIAHVDNPREARTVVAIAGSRMSARGVSTLLVDLGDAGGLERAVTHAHRREHQVGDVPTVLRPDGIVHLARGPFGQPAGTRDLVPADDPRRVAWDHAEVVLALASIDPGRGIDELSSWGTRVVMVVRAGASSAERLRAAADMVRAAGMELAFALLVGTDASDQSLGVPAGDLTEDSTPGRKAAR
jgi:capsular polysaccharide biosynthesis protein